MEEIPIFGPEYSYSAGNVFGCGNILRLRLKRLTVAYCFIPFIPAAKSTPGNLRILNEGLSDGQRRSA